MQQVRRISDKEDVKHPGQDSVERCAELAEILSATGPGKGRR